MEELLLKPQLDELDEKNEVKGKVDKDEVHELLEQLLAGDNKIVVSQKVPGLVALYGFRYNAIKWYRVESEWPEVNGKKAWESDRLIEQIGHDTRPGKGARDMGEVEKGFAVLLREGDIVKFMYRYWDEFRPHRREKKNSYYVYADGKLKKIDWREYNLRRKKMEMKDE